MKSYFKAQFTYFDFFLKYIQYSIFKKKTITPLWFKSLVKLWSVGIGIPSRGCFDRKAYMFWALFRIWLVRELCWEWIWRHLVPFLLCEGLKVGVRPRVGENGLVERVEIVKVIKCLMEEEEGEKMRERMNELKEAAINAIKEDGSSTRTLSQLALKWKSLA